MQESRITLSILQKTGIGKTVNNLRRVIANEDLSTVAKSLLKNWKRLVPGLYISFLAKTFIIFSFPKESSSIPIHKDDKQSTPTNSNNSQQSQETNNNTGKTIESSKSIERQNSQPASNSSYTASHTYDEVRYVKAIFFLN